MQTVIVGVIVKQDDKILMVQEAKEKAYGLWNMPAGHLDNTENILEGAKREFKEETGYDVKLTGMLPIQNYIDENNKHLIVINFYGEITGGELFFDKNELLNVKWIPLNELKNMTDKELRAYTSKMDMFDNIEKGLIYPLEIIKHIIEK